MVVALALLAAVAYGLSDFVGGLVSRRTSAWAVAFTGNAAAFAIFSDSDEVEGRRVFFVAPNARSTPRRAAGARSSALVIAPTPSVPAAARPASK